MNQIVDTSSKQQIKPINELSLYAYGSGQYRCGAQMSVGIVILDMDSKSVTTYAEFIPAQAESGDAYVGLIIGLKVCRCLMPKIVHCFIDCEYVVDQMNGKKKEYYHWSNVLKHLLLEKQEYFDIVTYEHVPRTDPNMTKAYYLHWEIYNKEISNYLYK